MPLQNGIPVDLKSLLSKWKLECILSHLLAEKIDTDVLAMMKLSHIRLLLQNFPLGTQIRFEYYLEQWRDEIGKPFHISTNENRLEFITKDHDLKSKISTREMESKSTQTDLIIYNISTAPSNKDNESNKDNTSSITLVEDAVNTESTPEPLPPSNLSSTLKSFRPTPQPTPEPLPPSNLSSTLKSFRPTPQVDLLTILKNASCGISLITSYGLRQSFTNAERTLLIDTIVDYYLTNNLEFNIQTNHAVEQAILKMFPSEQLSSYRTAKCGKIFISYIRARAKAAKPANKSSESITKITLPNGDYEESHQLADDNVMVQNNNTTESAMTDITPMDDTVLSDNTDSMVFTFDQSDDEENKIGTKINTGEVDISATLDSAKLICKMLSHKRQRIESIDRPFIDFCIPWAKVPQDIMSTLENGQPLGRRLNTFSNIIIDELRKISTQVPMRVLRAVNQQAVMKYPHSFLDKDSLGNIKPSNTTALLSRLRNRNTFLNRQENR